ncbi:Hypothetical protein LOCK900_2534 [Lacticaseibacillus rhamnosus LOCK900]|nr:Hypothetical protein LOCK900_2534 [Lacticaseibacillus rhamnosus LOCK900]
MEAGAGNRHKQKARVASACAGSNQAGSQSQGKEENDD